MGLKEKAGGRSRAFGCGTGQLVGGISLPAGWKIRAETAFGPSLLKAGIVGHANPAPLNAAVQSALRQVSMLFLPG
jgi:hypothetical protein